MRDVVEAVRRVRQIQEVSRKPLAVVLAGHNGSGKSTLWRERLSDELRIPLVNADRMMLSVLPEATREGRLTQWATLLRDTDESWMQVAQRGVQAFVGHAMNANVPFAMETVFSHWNELADGRIESKVDLIRQMQSAGYFVLLIFVGLASVELSIGRVATRVREHGHAVREEKLRQRFPRTRNAVTAGLEVADAALLVDNSRTPEQAFTLCRVQALGQELFDIRSERQAAKSVLRWLDVVSPRPTAPEELGCVS